MEMEEGTKFIGQTDKDNQKQFKKIPTIIMYKKIKFE
jgi:hypothetical protein